MIAYGKTHLPVISFSGIFPYFEQKKYEVLLFSFMLLIFGDTFTPKMILITVVIIHLNFIIGFIIFYNIKWIRNIIVCIFLLSIALIIFKNKLSFLDTHSWHNNLYLLYFSLVTLEVFKKILYVKTVSRELLAAALCGFVLLCLIATFLFSYIDTRQPDSFSGLGETAEMIDNLNYFSFTTMFTLGFGDITPQTLIAKRAVMLMGLMGHFYTVFITSIIIGKYVSAKNKIYSYVKKT